MPDESLKLIDGLEPDTEKALWWYELSGDSESITKCQQYMEAEKNGFYISDVYGKCGINPNNKNIVKINIRNFNGGALKSNMSYDINLIGADMSEGRLEVEGATLEEYDDVARIRDLQGDSNYLEVLSD